MNKKKLYEIEGIEDDNKVTLSFVHGSPSVRKAIIEIGCSIHDNINVFVSVKTTEHDNTLYNELKNTLQKVIIERDQYINDILTPKNNEIESLKRHIEENDLIFAKKTRLEKEYYEKKIEKAQEEIDNYVELSLKPKNEEIAFLKNNLNKNNEEFNKQKEDEIKRLEEYNNRYVESLKDHIFQLQKLNDLQKIQLQEYERKKSMNVVKMGQIGESNVEQYIADHFIEGKIKNTTKTGGQGDLHFTYKNCDILLEVKNKDRISPDDIIKFERDVQETDCMGGVFVSIKPNVNVPCHSVYDLEWINNKPIIYITNFETLPDMLYLAIKTIYYYVIYKQEQDKHVNTTDIQNQLIKYKQELDHIIENIKMFKPLLEDASLNVTKLNDSIHKMQNIMKSQLQSFFLNEDTNEEKLQFVMNVMKQKSINGKLPSYEELVKTPGISKKDISILGGMNKIRNEYKKNIN